MPSGVTGSPVKRMPRARRSLRRSAGAVSVIAALLVLSVPGFPHRARAAEPAPKPEWTPGDFWAYGVSQPVPGGAITSREWVNVTGEEDLVVAGHEWHVYNVTDVAAVASPLGSSTLTFRYWYRTSDLAEVLSSSAEYDFVGYEDPPVEVRWPLAVGAAWNGSSASHNRMGAENATIPFAYNYSVEDGGVRATPAGAFETLLLRRESTTANGTSVDRKYWSPLVGNEVLIVRTTTPDLPLTNYRFQRGPSPSVDVALWAGVLLVVAVAATAALWLVLRRLRPRKGVDGGPLPERPRGET